MKNIKLNNKKVGIWGFGIVGKSAYNYVQQYTNHIQILDKNTVDHPAWIAQTKHNIQSFLQNNDFIIASPGIPLHTYQDYKHKFITELDILEQQFHGTVIAITGTLGKTSITNLLQQCIPSSIATGNIGYAMLNVLQQVIQPEKIILELSSFQLQHTKKFTPQMSIWTNFYPNHLDHHLSEQEYFKAKCKILQDQSPDHITLLPCHLIEKIKQTISIKPQIYAFCIKQCSKHLYPTFSIKNNSIMFEHKIIFDNINQLSSHTFQENWLIIITTLYLQNISLEHVTKVSNQLTSQEHRLEKIREINGSVFYNDSKSTVWQATKQALDSLDSQSCALFLGGLSKGTDRTPLIQHLQNKKITVFAFGKEAHTIQNLCNTYQVTCTSFDTLDQAFRTCTKSHSYKDILFSPAGASFDLFKNYLVRGEYFKKLVTDLAQISTAPFEKDSI